MAKISGKYENRQKVEMSQISAPQKSVEELHISDRKLFFIDLLGYLLCSVFIRPF